jgi:hypothetical protein
MVLAIGVAGCLLTAGCSSGGSDAGPTTTSRRAPSTTAGSTRATTTAPPVTTAPGGSTVPPPTTRPSPPKGCTEGGTPPPSGAVVRRVGDVDGDGRPDTAWMAPADDTGSHAFGITTAAGGGAITPYTSASPVRRSVLVVDADGKAPTEVLFDDGRTVRLSVFEDCQIQDVQNPEGEQYTFGLGFNDVGTGIGCIDTPHGRRLVGLDAKVDPDDDSVVRWSSTEVVLDGTRARNGTRRTGTYHRPADDAKVELLHDVTCGELTVDDDSVGFDG